MPKTAEEIRAIIEAGANLSAAETLTLYRNVRDQVLAAAWTEHGTKRIEIRQRQHEVSDPAAFLRFLEDRIRYYEKKADAEKYGASRNYARLNMRARRWHKE